MTTKCPICGSENVTPSHLRGFERLLRFIFPRTPYRCKECWSRFWQGSIKGPAFKIILGIVVLLFAIFGILPISKFFDKNKDKKEKDTPKTVSKIIEKQDKLMPDKPVRDDSQKADQSDKDRKGALKADSEEDDDEGSPDAAKKDSLKKNTLAGKPVKPDKVVKSDKSVKPDKTVVAKAVKKPDTAADEEDEGDGPQAPQLPKLREPNVEVPKGGKTPTKAVVKTAAPKAEVKPEKKADPKKELDEAEKDDEKADEKVLATPSGSVRSLKNITAKASDKTVEIVISADGPIRDYKKFFLLKENPPKLVVDINGKWRYGGKYTMDVKSELISKIRVAEHNEKGFFRVVMDLKAKEGMTPVFNEDAKGLVIIVKK